jgi:hypothetical protein
VAAPPIVPEAPSERQDDAPALPPCGCPRDGRPRGLRVAGYLGRRVSGLPCWQPLRVICGDCAGQEAWACNGHRASACPPCSERYRRRLVRVADAGLDAHAARHRYMLTLTAPSLDGHRQWSLDPRVRGDDRPMCSCDRSAEGGLGAWNARAAARWNRLRTALARMYPGLDFLRAAEVQKRGALHFHVLLVTDRPVDPVAVQRVALEAGFGCVLDLAPITDAKRASYYVSKYVTKSCDDRGNVPWSAVVCDEDTGEMRLMETLPTFRSWSSSRGWGLTMKEVRAALLHSARLRAAALGALPVEDGAGSPELVAASVADGASLPPP